VTEVRKGEKGNPSGIFGRCGSVSGGVLGSICWAQCILSYIRCIMSHLVHCVVQWFLPPPRLEFSRPLCLMDRTLRIQDIIFADVG